MNARAHIPVDKATYFDFVRSQSEGRFEYDRGLIVQQMTAGTGWHSTVAQRFVSVIERQLGIEHWLVSSHARGVDTAETVRQPDVLVERAPIDLDSLATASPELIVEVLSPSTRALDLTVKPGEYTSLASLHAYIVAEQNIAKCYVWMRGTDGAFPSTPVEVSGTAASLSIEPLLLVIPLADIYRGIA